MSHPNHKISILKTVLTQPEDSCGPNEGGQQELSIETCDAGGGPYCVISTNRCAIETEEEIELLLRHIRIALEQKICHE